MKKIIFSLVLLSVIFYVGLSVSAAQITECDVKIESGVLTVTGELDGNGKVGIHIHNSDDELVYINDAYVEADSPMFEFKMAISSKTSQRYTVKVGGEGIAVTEREVEFIISDKKDFLNFAIGENRGIINNSTNTVKVEVSDGNLKNLVASFAVSDMATVSIDGVVQESGITKNDFSSDVVYTITAQDGSSKNYTVKVIRKKESTSGSGGRGGSGGGSKVVAFDALVPGTDANESENNINKECFTDLDGVQWAKEWIYYLYNQGVVSGVTPTTFEPERSIKREEFVKMLILALGENTGEQVSIFDDVSSDMWYAGYINAAVEKGIVNGISNTEFGIGMNITRQDMAVMVYRAFGSERFKTDFNEVKLTDEEQISDYASEEVLAMTRSGIINGTGYGAFEPTKSATRAEAAKVIGKLMSMK